MIDWFSKDRRKPVPPSERGPLAVGIGGAIQIDFLSLEADTLGADPAMALPKSSAMIISAYGEVRLDAATVLSRYYDDEHRMLQILSSSGAPGDAITDVTYYVPWDSVVPASQQEWDRWTGNAGLIGQVAYDADGIAFQRFWGDGPGRAQPVEFIEEVDDGAASRSIHQTCMLYHRPLGAVREMLLINVERDLATGHARAGASIEFLVGYGLEPADVRRV